MLKRNHFIFISILLTVTVFVLSVYLFSSSASTVFQVSVDELPPTPSPGPEPTSIPESLEGAIPVTNEVEALKRAIVLDRAWSTRAAPLEIEGLLANSDSYVVEFYGTWQEASDRYCFGTLEDSPSASEPVWVVILKGDVTVHTMGGDQQTDGITLIIAQNTGYLLSMASGALPKR